VSLLLTGEAATAVAVASLKKSWAGRRKQLTAEGDAGKFCGSHNELVATATKRVLKKELQSKKRS
jgi:hypothetical protein